jgi:hypothetical protein
MAAGNRKPKEIRMFRSTSFVGGALLALALAGPAPARAQATPPATVMQPGKPMSLGPVVGERVIRQIMIGDNGTTVDLIYDMAPGAPESRRVVRLENKNGMLEVVYDQQPGTSRPLASGGTPRLVAKTGGMYDVVYDK